MSSPFEADPELTRYQQEQYDEYTSFKATQPINWQGARAFNPGDPVPASTVENRGWLEMGLVEKVEGGAAWLADKDGNAGTPDQPADVDRPVGDQGAPKKAAKSTSKNTGGGE